ncbi:hypothetical protein [Faecalimonas sp.]
MKENKMGKEYIYVEKISDERLERIYCDSLEIIHRMKRDAILRKVYSDVDFYELLDKIMEIREAKEDLKKLNWE